MIYRAFKNPNAASAVFDGRKVWGRSVFEVDSRLWMITGCGAAVLRAAPTVLKVAACRVVSSIDAALQPAVKLLSEQMTDITGKMQ